MRCIKSVVSSTAFVYLVGPAVMLLSYKFLGSAVTMGLVIAYLVVTLAVGGLRPAKDPSASIARSALFGSLCVMAMVIDAAGLALPLVILASIYLIKALRHEANLQANPN